MRNVSGPESEPRWRDVFFSWGAAMLLAFIGLYFLPVLVRAFIVSPDELSAPWLRAAHLAAEGVRLIGAVGASIIAVDLLLNTPFSVAYVEKRMRRVIRSQRGFFDDIIEQVLSRKVSSKEYLATLPTSALNETHAHIIEIVADGTFPHKGTFYRTLRERIEPLLMMPHIDTADISITNYVCTASDGSMYIRSKRRYEYTIHSNSKQPVDGMFGKTVRLVSGIDIAEHYKLESFKIGQTQLKKKLSKPKVSDDGSSCEWRLEFAYPIGEDERITMLRRETVLIPIDDVIDWRVQRNLTCKNLKVSVEFPDAMVNPRILVYGLASPDEEWDCTPESTDNSCEVRWKGWMLPDHSFVVTWSPPALSATAAAGPPGVASSSAARSA